MSAPLPLTDGRGPPPTPLGTVQRPSPMRVSRAPGFERVSVSDFRVSVRKGTTMNQDQKPLPRLVSTVGARNILGLHNRTFDRLLRAGVFRHVGGGLETASLATCLAKALEVEREAKEKIEAIEAETRRRLAAIGQGLEN